jgi:SNF2 family DNA or RNA helicase
MLKYKIEKKIMKLKEEKKEVTTKLKPEQKGSFSKFF